MFRDHPFVPIALCWGAGILLHETIGYQHFSCLAGQAAGAALLLSCLVTVRRKISFLVLLCALTVVSAMIHAHAWRTFSARHVFFSYARYFGHTVDVDGVVVVDPRRENAARGERTQFVLAVRRIRVDGIWQEHTGKVLVKIYHDVSWRYGDRVVVEGKLRRPTDFSRKQGFSYRRYLNRKGIMLVLHARKDAAGYLAARGEGHAFWAEVLASNQRLQAALARYLDPPDNAVAVMILLGERREVAKPLWDIFVRTGTAHVLAISGLHVGIVAALIFLLLRILPVSLRAQYFLTIVLVAGYALITGATPSVVRSAIMSAIFLGGFLLEREPDNLNSLAAAALVILWLNPMALFEIGFQLSFISVAGMVLGLPLFIDRLSDRPLWGNRVWRYLVTSVLVSLTAGLAVAGLIAYYFRIITPVMLLANLVVVPLSTAVVALGTGLLLFSAIPWVAGPFAACLKCAINLMVWSADMFSRVPGASFYLPEIHWGWILLYYAIILGAWGWISRFGRGRERGGKDD